MFPNRHTDEERRAQIEEGRALARNEGAPTNRIPGRIGASRPRTDAAAPRKAPPKGHEAFLKALETAGAVIRLEKCDGSIIEGIVRHSDKYTVTMRVFEVDFANPDGDKLHRDRVIFKHDVSEFSALTPRAEAH